jgi:hypothetical protein
MFNCGVPQKKDWEPEEVESSIESIFFLFIWPENKNRKKKKKK